MDILTKQQQQALMNHEFSLGGHDIAYDRNLIEQSFKDYEDGLILTDEELYIRFGKYGWCQ